MIVHCIVQTDTFNEHNNTFWRLKGCALSQDRLAFCRASTVPSINVGHVIKAKIP